MGTTRATLLCEHGYLPWVFLVDRCNKDNKLPINNACYVVCLEVLVSTPIFIINLYLFTTKPKLGFVASSWFTIVKSVSITTLYLTSLLVTSSIKDSCPIVFIVVAMLMSYIVIKCSPCCISSFFFHWIWNIHPFFFPIFIFYVKVVKVCFFIHGQRVKWPNPCNSKP